MKREDLFSIGDVSKMFGLSPGTLRHYETLGLVSPEYTDAETGYRYYSVRQFEPLNTIRYLRMLDMPLPEIRDFFKNKDVGVIREKLLNQREETVKKIRELENIKQKLDRRISVLDDACASKLDTVTVTSLPPCRMAVNKSSVILHSGLDLEKPIRDIARLFPSEVVFLGKVGVGISAEKLAAGEFGEYDYVFLFLEEEDGDGCGRPSVVFPETRCVSVRFRGSHSESPSHYAELMKYIGEHGFEVAGFSREVTLIDYGFTNDASEFVTEISVPIK